MTRGEAVTEAKLASDEYKSCFDKIALLEEKLEEMQESDPDYEDINSELS